MKRIPTLASALILVCLPLTVSNPALAGTAAPACIDHGQALPVDDAQAVDWENSKSPGFLQRAHIAGALTQVLPNHSGHHHFNVQVGSAASAVVEIVFDDLFGSLPLLQVGMQVEACGDFIEVVPHSPGTTGYAPAIVHWVHRTDTPSHDAGYVFINGVTYGQSGSGR